MSDTSDRLIDFEADHYDALVEKFLNRKSINDLWSDFVYQEYMDNQPEPPDELKHPDQDDHVGKRMDE